MNKVCLLQGTSTTNARVNPVRVYNSDILLVTGCGFTGVQYCSEALVAIQRLQQLLDLPNGHGLGSSSDETDKVTIPGLENHIIPIYSRM